MRRDMTRKEYRICLNLNNPYHRYVADQIQKATEDGRSGTEIIIKALYDYFHQMDVLDYLEPMYQNLLSEVRRSAPSREAMEAELPFEKADREMDESDRYMAKEEVEEPETMAEHVFDLFEDEDDKEEDGAEADQNQEEESEALAPGVVSFMRNFN